MNGVLANFPVLVPLSALCGWGVVVLLAETFATDRRFRAVAWMTIIGLVVTAMLAATPLAGVTYAGALALDAYASFFTVLICALGVVTVLLSLDYLPAAGIVRGEYYAILLYAVAGAMVMASATDLVTMFIGLEVMSMAVYVLAGIRKHVLASNEAALKYFLMGAFASAILLYGIALLYALTGSTVLGEVAAGLAGADFSDAQRLLANIGMGLLLVGMAFKIAAVPFHLWAPDVYEGSPTTITAFMATAVKAAGFAALVRIVVVALAPAAASLAPLLWTGAVATMTVGNLVALRQTSFKRMLAYSSIAHTGYLLVGVTAATPQAGAAILFYLAAYGAMNMGAFAVFIALARGGRVDDRIEELAGLGRSHPLIALVMTACMLSLVGFPPLGGFVGKLYLFQAALAAGQTWLVVIALVNSVISAVYYLSVVRTMYFEEDRGGSRTPGLFANAAIGLSGAVVLMLGLAPSPWLGMASRAVAQVVVGP